MADNEGEDRDGGLCSTLGEMFVNQAWRVLSALLAGLSFGWACQAFELNLTASLEAAARLVGGLWLDALKMTILPLVGSLLIVGICETAEHSRSSRLGARILVLIGGLLCLATALAAVVSTALLSLWPSPVAGHLVTGTLTMATAPDLSAFARGILPHNVFQAAAEGSVLSIVVFCILFAIGLTRVEAPIRKVGLDFFRACSGALLQVVGGVLWLAPLGVLALAFNLGVTTGGAALGGLAHYVLIVSLVGVCAWLLAYPVAIGLGGLKLRAFSRAVLPAQAVALSTQSSIAALPSMLAAAKSLGVQEETAGFSLPIAVALFRITGPAMNLAVAIYTAHVLGLTLAPHTVAAGAAIAVLTTVGSVGLPGQTSFLTSITPIAAVMGVPVEPLVIFLAIEMAPDLIRTVGNVTADVALAAAVDRDAVPTTEETPC